jgi:hypothetical protein
MVERWRRGAAGTNREEMETYEKVMERLTEGVGGGEAADRRGSSYVHCAYEPYRAQNMVL